MATVLLIDDDDSVLQALTIVGEALGHKMIPVKDPKEALLRFEAYGAQVVITDLLMPERDGFEMIRDFRKLFPKVKIIAITGGGQMSPELYLDMAESLGASYTLSKPFSIQELDLAISKALANDE